MKLPTIRRLDRLVVSGAGKTDAVRRSTYFWEATLTDENSQHCLPQGYQQQGPRDSHRLARFQLSFTLPPVGEEHCGVYVCLPVFVCLFSGNTRFNFYRGSILLWRRCDTLRTFGFIDNVIFSRNGPCDTVAVSDVIASSFVG